MVERELRERAPLDHLADQYLDFEALPDEKRGCRVCNTTMFLSSVQCACHPGYLHSPFTDDVIATLPLMTSSLIRHVEAYLIPFSVDALFIPIIDVMA